MSTVEQGDLMNPIIDGRMLAVLKRLSKGRGLLEDGRTTVGRAERRCLASELLEEAGSGTRGKLYKTSEAGLKAIATAQKPNLLGERT